MQKDFDRTRFLFLRFGLRFRRALVLFLFVFFDQNARVVSEIVVADHDRRSLRIFLLLPGIFFGNNFERDVVGGAAQSEEFLLGRCLHSGKPQRDTGFFVALRFHSSYVERIAVELVQDSINNVPPSQSFLDLDGVFVALGGQDTEGNEQLAQLADARRSFGLAFLGRNVVLNASQELDSFSEFFR